MDEKQVILIDSEEKLTITENPEEKEITFEDYMSKVDVIKCPGCKYDSSTENVRLHIKRLHMAGKFCKICDKEFADRRGEHCAKHLLIAIISHLREQCSECSKFFMLDSKRSEDETFICKVCSNKSGNSETPSTDSSTPKLPHRCDTCFKRFAHRKTLNEHVRTVHADNELYQCEYCPRVFHYRKNLNAHRRVHTNPVVCEICFAEFSNPHNLNRHMFSHADAPTYNCGTCGKMFRSAIALENHNPCRLEIIPEN